MSGLEPFGEEIWIASGPVIVSMNFRYPTRMALIRLPDRGLFVWSPVALTPDLRAAVHALGDVRFLVAPNALHHLSLPEWRAAYPRAKLYAAPGLRRRRADIPFDVDLTDAPDPAWAGEIDQAAMAGNLITNEIVFFHRRSGTALIADLIQNFPPGWFTGWRAAIARLDGMVAREPQTPMKFRLAFVGRAAARKGLAKILAWRPRKLVCAHAPPVSDGASGIIAHAFRWLA